jgi:hypothetical protein
MIFDVKMDSDQGFVMIVREALYGLKSVGKSWRNMLSESLQAMGWQNTIADPTFRGGQRSKEKSTSNTNCSCYMSSISWSLVTSLRRQ